MIPYYKAFGEDEVRPVCLQRRLDILLPQLCRLFRTSVAKMVVACRAGIQRMVCLAITGAFPKVPVAAQDCASTSPMKLLNTCSLIALQ
ncbi:hypothetical protein J6590_011842 [Homalodisca vitripennis]|nr:hypothetical protein J6590_011842 [Homalodisca vitripennis]